MNEEQKNLKGATKVTLKSFSRGFLVILIILFFAFFSIAAVYVKNKDDMDKASETVATYSTSVDSSGRIVYTHTDPENPTITETVTPEDIAEDLEETLGEYVSEDEEEYTESMTYLIEAESVTKQPYIDSLGEGELNGRIKFYRYNETEGEINAEDLTEENRLKYMPLLEFNSKLEAYKSNAAANRDIFKRFTIDNDGTVLVAYGTEEYRDIDTGVDGGEKDRDLTTDIINESSTATKNYTGNCDSGFSSTDFKIFTKPVDYLSLAEQYVMPFNLLNSLLIQTADINFVKEVASLAYESEIAIGIYDNKSYSQTIQTFSYKKLMKVNVETSFDYKDTMVSITDSEPSIILKENDLASLPYEYIPIKCETQTTDDGQIQHKSIYKKEGNGAWSAVTGYKMYINETNADNKIITLGEGATYNTTYKRTIDSMSTPTIGILYADTWIAKWEAAYTKEENDIPASSTPETALENKEITSYTNDNFLAAFSDSAGISSQLTGHGNGIRTNTISSIISLTPEDIFVVEPEIYTITEADKKNVLKEHLEEHSSCQSLLSYLGYTINSDNINVEPFFDAVMNATSGNLGRVKQDFDEKWAEFEADVEERNANAERIAQQKTRERKATFETQLNEVGTVSYRQTLSGNKNYVNILTSSSSSGNSSKYEKSETITRTEEGEKFAVIFNDQQFYESKNAILNREEWFWEYIRENEDTAKLEDTLRYLLNIATESNDFGTFTEEEIKKLFGAFEPPTEQIEPTTSHSGMNLLQQYVRMFENSYIFNYVYGNSNDYTDVVAKYITQDRSAYYVRSDGHNHPTVGFGVDLFNGAFYDEGLGREITFATYLIDFYGYTEAQLRNMDGTTTIPSNIVDELEEKELKEKFNDVVKMNEEESLGLKKYQMYALTSFNFNTGKMYKYGSYNNFITMYREHWDSEEDDRYGENSADYTHILYTDFFYKSRFSNGQEVPGLITRRESEWMLFQTGYMNNINKSVTDQEYPAGIRTFQAAGYTFPEYPQKKKVGDVNLYATSRFGYPEADKTLGSSGCGVFSMSMILSGLLGDASIDPITYRDAMERDERIGYSYHSWDSAKRKSSGSIWTVLCNEDFLSETYGVQVEGTWIDYDTGIQALNEGKAILAIEPGHYVAVIPVPDELQGQGYEFFVLDSARGHTGAYKSKSDFITRTGYDSLEFLAIIAP